MISTMQDLLLLAPVNCTPRAERPALAYAAGAGSGAFCSRGQGAAGVL